MAVYATSDLHGRLPHVPEDCDTLLIAGDICPDHPIGKKARYDLPDNGAAWQANWLQDVFRPYLQSLAERDLAVEVVGIWGNHDFVGEHPELVPPMPWNLIQDEVYTTADGYRIWGTPWVPGLPRWAFSADSRALAARADLIPDDLDVLMPHGPPYGVADFVAPQFGSVHVGDGTLNMAITLKQPRLVVCGHIHEQFGVHDLHGVPIYNVAYVDEFYEPRAGIVKLHDLS